MHFCGVVSYTCGMKNRAAARRPYPSDVSDDEWEFAVSYLTLNDASARQREYPLREPNAARCIVAVFARGFSSLAGGVPADAALDGRRAL